MSDILPKITVVTPSFNQAAFLETTMLSVLGQCYPKLEYIVMDGGSTDGSADIIRRYEAQLAYSQSQADGGQSAAINAAFARATGDVLCWINSDDFLLPGTLHKIARLIGVNFSEPLLVYGACLFFHERGKQAKVVRPRAHDSKLLRLTEYLIQPSSFWTRALWEKTGPLDDKLAYAFDWDWFIRASAHGRFVASEEMFSAYRFHEAHKSSGGGERRRNEIFSVARKHSAPEQIAAYEYLDRHWSSLEKRRALRETLRQRRVPASEFLARLGTPGLDAPPAGVTEEMLRLAEGMFRGA